jgi:GTP-binding protein
VNASATRAFERSQRDARETGKMGADLYQPADLMVNLTSAPPKPQVRPQVRQPPWSQARFVLAAHRLSQLPADTGSEVAFAGRSNAGKSSAINALTGVSALARISKTPGRTQQLVVFAFDDARRLIDLPGYGYAKVPMALREHWGETLDAYFQQRESLSGLMLMMDIRHPMTEFDHRMLGFAAANGRACHVLLTKADKLGRGAQATTLRQVRAALTKLDERFSVQLFSSVTKDGVDAARGVVSGWLSKSPVTAHDA